MVENPWELPTIALKVNKKIPDCFPDIVVIFVELSIDPCNNRPY